VSSMSRDLAREIGRERAAGARHRRLVNEMKAARQAERRAKREAAGRWWRRRGAPVGVGPALSAASAPPPEDGTRELGVLLDRIAERIAEHGTATERPALEALHDTTRWAAPGASAALVDPDGSETARLRAFGVLHGVVLGVLGPEDRAWLLDRLRGGNAHELDDRVA
jgi:hypothetical protein